MTLRDVALMALSALIAVVVSTMAAQSSGKNVVRVNELILENDKGEVVGILSTFNNGSPYLHLSNGQSTASIYLEGTSAKVFTRSKELMSGVGIDRDIPFVKVRERGEDILVTSFTSPLVDAPSIRDSYTQIRLHRGGQYYFFPDGFSRYQMRDMLLIKPSLTSRMAHDEWKSKLAE